MKTKHNQAHALWRISIHENLDGFGGLETSARWHTEGHRIVYLAESPSGSMLEILAHLPLEEADLPDFFRILKVEGLEEVTVVDLTPPNTDDWTTNEFATQKIGDAWLDGRKSALARVPSAIIPYTWNYLLNPRHPDSEKLKIVASSKHLYDPRLLRVR